MKLYTGHALLVLLVVSILIDWVVFSPMSDMWDSHDSLVMTVPPGAWLLAWYEIHRPQMSFQKAKNYLEQSSSVGYCTSGDRSSLRRKLLESHCLHICNNVFFQVKTIFDITKATISLVASVHDDSLILGKWDIHNVFINPEVRFQKVHIWETDKNNMSPNS